MRDLSTISGEIRVAWLTRSSTIISVVGGRKTLSTGRLRGGSRMGRARADVGEAGSSVRSELRVRTLSTFTFTVALSTKSVNLSAVGTGEGRSQEVITVTKLTLAESVDRITVGWEIVSTNLIISSQCQES